MYIWNPLKSETEKAMAPHSSTLAWKIPWTEEPDRLQSTGLQRVGHDWVTEHVLCMLCPSCLDVCVVCRLPPTFNQSLVFQRSSLHLSREGASLA